MDINGPAELELSVFWIPDGLSFAGSFGERCSTRDGLRLLPLAAFMLVALCVGCTSEKSSPDFSTTQTTSSSADDHAINATAVQQVPTVAAFADMTVASAIRFTYRNGQESGHYAILESLGGGIGIIDYDNDGDVDLFAPGGGGYLPDGSIIGSSSGLFCNDGGWSFSTRTLEAGVDFAPWYTHGAAVGDFDNDGFSDVLITGYGGLLFYQNQGDGTFRQGAGDAGLSDSLWSSSAAWGDVNGDGNPDLYVAHYVDWSLSNHPICEGPETGLREVCPPLRFEPLSDVFYESNGDGTFTDVSSTINLRKDGKGLGVLMADVDLDGRLDIYVANDTVANFLYWNKGDGHLEDVSLRSGTSLSDTGTPDGSMGVDVGDFNLDGRPDLWVANYERESFALYRNEGGLLFQHVSRATGITAVGGLAVGWGTVFIDFDRDGDEDIFTSNGHVIRYPRNAPLRQPPLLLQNESGERFRNVAPVAGDYLQTPHMGRGVVAGDMDDDGDQDLAISLVNEPMTVLSNESGNNNSLVIRLIGTQSSRDAVGALIRVQTTVDQPYMIRLMKSGGSYASSNDPRQFFGLGRASSAAKVEIRWPSGIQQTLENVSCEKMLVLREPEMLPDETP